MTQARNAARKITKIFGVSPMPISTMASGMIASGGMVRKNWTHGSTRPRTTAYQPIRKPDRDRDGGAEREAGRARGPGWRRCRRCSVPFPIRVDRLRDAPRAGSGSLNPAERQHPPQRDAERDRDARSAAAGGRSPRRRVAASTVPPARPAGRPRSLSTATATPLWVVGLRARSRLRVVARRPPGRPPGAASCGTARRARRARRRRRESCAAAHDRLGRGAGKVARSAMVAAACSTMTGAIRVISPPMTISAGLSAIAAAPSTRPTRGPGVAQHLVGDRVRAVDRGRRGRRDLQRGQALVPAGGQDRGDRGDGLEAAVLAAAAVGAVGLAP